MYNITYYIVCCLPQADMLFPLQWDSGCLNNDRTVMSRPYAWWVLACLPNLKGSACTNTSKEWQAQFSIAWPSTTQQWHT